MSSTRDFKSPGIFAEDATTVIPPTPIAGVSYRDAVSGTDDVPNGWRYGTRVESQDWNQIMFLMTSMMGVIDKKGVLGWSDQVNYDEAAITFGSDGQLYLWSAPSGPGNGGAQDPTSTSGFWTSFASSFSSPAEIRMVATSTIPSGWLECDGQAVSRTTYSALFAAIGTVYGAGNGTTTFNIPDMRGEFPRGWDHGRGVDAGRTLGSSQLDAFQGHTFRAAQSGGGSGPSFDVWANSTPVSAPVAPISDGVNGTPRTASETRGRNVALMFIIKT